MSKINFGEFNGRSFEWLFFNAPWYADWLFKRGVLETRWDYDEDERNCFRELHERASALAGVCPYCLERNVVRRALSTYCGKLGVSTFCCAECKPITEGRVLYEAPSFFMRPEQWTREDQKSLTATIKMEYVGRGNLTQRKMEEFFRNDELFWHATPKFFTQMEVQQ